MLQCFTLTNKNKSEIHFSQKPRKHKAQISQLFTSLERSITRVKVSKVNFTREQIRALAQMLRARSHPAVRLVTPTEEFGPQT